MHTNEEKIKQAFYINGSNLTENSDQTMSVNHPTCFIRQSFLRYSLPTCTHLSLPMKLVCKNDNNPHCCSEKIIEIPQQI